MTPIQVDEPRKKLWSREEFYKLLDQGYFLDQRVELIEGEIIEMASQKNLHAVGVALGEFALQGAFGPQYWVRVQMTLDLSPYSAPDPDLAVILGTPRSLAAAPNPTSALLIQEVSDTTLRYDRDHKGSLYARVNILDYWILNLVDRQLEVHRDPGPDPSQKFGFGYQKIIILGPNDTISPLALPQAKILVADLLP